MFNVTGRESSGEGHPDANAGGIGNAGLVMYHRVGAGVQLPGTSEEGAREHCRHAVRAGKLAFSIWEISSIMGISGTLHTE